MNFKSIFRFILIFILVSVVLTGAFFVTSVIKSKIDEKNFINLSYQVIELTKTWWQLPTEQGGGGGYTVTQMIDRYIDSLEDPDILASIKGDIESGISFYAFIAVTPEWNNLIMYLNSNIIPPGNIPSEQYGNRVGNEHGNFGIVLGRDNPDFLAFVGAKYNLFFSYNFSVSYSFDPNDHETIHDLEIYKWSLWRAIINKN